MTVSKIETLTIQDESVHGEKRFQLYIDNERKALLVKRRNGLVELNWQLHGPQHWPNAKVFIEGILQLSVLADQLSNEENTTKDEDR